MLVLLCIAFANFAVSAATLEYNQLKLKNGKVLTFASCSKVDRHTLRVILTNGKVVKITRNQLSDAEALKRLGSKFAMRYGKAYYVKSKLPESFSIADFKEKYKPLIDELRKGSYNAVKAGWKRLLEDDKVDSIDQLFLPDNPIMNYYYFVPDKKNIKKREKVPLVVFLHGIGECGDDVKKLFVHTQVLTFISDENQKKYPCFFLAPQLPGKNSVWTYGGYRSKYPNNATDNMMFVISIIDEMIRKYPGIDQNRIYVTGLSSGGHGCWAAISKFPGKFAGAVPVAAGWDAQLELIKTKQKIAVWAFMNPTEAKESRYDAVKLLNKAAKYGADCRYTKFAAMRKKKGKNGKMGKVKIPGHFAWLWAYAEPDLIPWLFAHKREKKFVSALVH
jgi:pimeloyl-ACP methyl ester carboxylesterase